MQDNIVFATDSMRSSVAALKRKLSHLKVSIEQFDAELDKIETKFDKLIVQTDIFKAKVEREMGREVRRLENELKKVRSQLNQEKIVASPSISSDEIKIASTIAIFECILRNMCGHSDDFLLISYAFLFPSVYERVVKAEDPAYLIGTLPDSSMIVIQRGREYIQYIRSTCETHVTDQSAWDLYLGEVTNWWRNDALPLLYGCQDERWEEDIPLSLAEMLIWKEDPAERPIHFSAVFDAFEIYKKNKDLVFESSGVRDLDLKMFRFDSSKEG